MGPSTGIHLIVQTIEGDLERKLSAINGLNGAVNLKEKKKKKTRIK